MLEEVTRDEVNVFFIEAFGKEKASIAQKAFEAGFNLNSQKLKKQVIDEIKYEIVTKDLLQAEFKASRAEFKQESQQSINELRNEVKQEINELRAEVKQEINELRAEVKQEINDLRTEVKDMIAKTQTNTLKWVIGIQITSLGVIIAAISILAAVLKF